MQSPSLLPLTAPQEGLWIAHQCAQDSSLYNVAEVVEICGPLDVRRLIRAIRLCFDASDTFHHRFVPSQDPGTTPAGLELFPEACLQQFSTRLIDASAMTASELDEQHWRPDLRTGVDLEKDLPFTAVLARQSPQLHSLYIRSHHICVDGLGLSLWLSKVWNTYNQLERDPDLAGVRPTSIVDALRCWLAYEDSERKHRDARFWQRTLKTRSAVRYAASDGPRLDHPRAQALVLPVSLQTQLRQYCEDNKIPEHALWIAAFSRSILEQHDDIELSVGIPFSNRLGSAAASVPCMWMNLLPLRVQSHPDPGLLHQARAITQTMRSYSRHRLYRHEWMRRDLRAIQGHADLFGPVFNPISTPAPVKVPGLEIHSRRLNGGPVQDLTLTWSRQGQAPATMEMELPIQLATPERFDRWSHRLLTTIERALHRSVPVRRTPQDPRPWLTQVQAHVSDQPDQVAVESRQSVLSYQELWDTASHLALLLERYEGPILLWLERGTHAIVAMLAARIAQRAYAPVDPQGPLDRNLAIIQGLKPALLLCDKKPPHALQELGLPTHDLRAPVNLDEAPKPTRTWTDPVAYWMHTSGSTGNARAVAIGHGALNAFVQAAASRYGWTSRDRILQFAPLAFDASVEEIFVALYCGATLVVRADSDSASIPSFVTSIRRKRITVVDLPTAFWHEWVYAAQDGDLGIPASLRQIIIGGEAVQEEKVHRWRAMAPPEVELLNTYGPTETTVVVSAATLNGAPGQAPLPTIGQPLDNIEIFVLDSQGNPVPPGETGELAVASATVSLGYADCPQHNRRAFVAAPKASGHARMYKTGDRGRFDEEGQLHYLGRIDQETKISGFRIHPGEVEAALLKHPEVSAAVVLVHRPSSGPAYLTAHIQSRSTLQDAQLASLRADLSQQLIASAIPRSITVHAKLPKTVSGKLDRQALAKAAKNTPASQPHSPKEPPLTGLAQQVAQAWEELLHVSVRSLDCDFFELGGESLHCLQLATRLSRALGMPLDANVLIHHSKLGDLCEVLEQGRLTGASESRELVQTRAQQDLETISSSIPLCVAAPKPSTPTSLLLTGATGFVGSALLESLRQIPGLQLTCLARKPPSADPQNNAIRWIQGDLEAPLLGLDERDFEALAETTQCILHCAGSVSLLHDYESCRASNVLGCATLLDLMSQGPAKRLLYLSTLAVAPGPSHAEKIPESRVAWHPGLHNGYTQSKWVAEQAVALAHDRGHACTALRIGRAYGTVPNPRDLLTRVVTASRRLHAWPQLDIRESWIRNEELCRITLAFIRSSSRWPALLNASDGHNYRWSTLFAQLRSPSDTTLALPEWLARLEGSDHLEDNALAGLLAPLLDQDTQAPYIGLPPAQSEFLRPYYDESPPHDRYPTLVFS